MAVLLIGVDLKLRVTNNGESTRNNAACRPNVETKCILLVMSSAICKFSSGSPHYGRCRKICSLPFPCRPLAFTRTSKHPHLTAVASWLTLASESSCTTRAFAGIEWQQPIDLVWNRGARKLPPIYAWPFLDLDDALNHSFQKGLL